MDLATLKVREAEAPAREQPVATRILQPFVLPCVGDQSCALRVKGAAEPASDEAGLRVPASKLVSFDAFLNSFYEGYWTRFTPLRRIALRVEGEGLCWCAVRRETASGSSSPVGHAVFALRPGEPRILEVRLRPDLEDGRLFAECGAFVDPVRVRTLSWVALDAPLREVRMGVAICTFDREPFVLRTLQRLLDDSHRLPLERIVVANHGPPLAGAEIDALRRRAGDRLVVVDQPNLGGAGGFTRGALELLASKAVTHVLFMDDDIEVDPAHLVTAAAFAAHATEPVVVGGQMLDLYKRELMFESGARVSSANLLEANHRDLDLERPASLRRLSEPAKPDFNGWWFSLIPAEAFRAHGLPLPIFIRGDDQEFGVRLARAGIQTLSLPPVSVWHEPFTAKPPGWQLYYDLRNRLIFASLYPDAYRLDGPVQLAKRLMAMLIRHDYAQARSIALALRDYLAGPSRLEGAADRHAQITAELAALGPPRVEKPDAPLGHDDHPPSKAAGRRRLLASCLRVLFWRPACNPAGRECLLYSDMALDLMTLGESYVLSDDGDHFFLRFTHSQRRSWGALVRTGAAIAAYGAGRRRAAQRWREAASGLTSFESWAARFGLPQAAAKAARGVS